MRFIFLLLFCNATKFFPSKFQIQKFLPSEEKKEVFSSPFFRTFPRIRGKVDWRKILGAIKVQFQHSRGRNGRDTHVDSPRGTTKDNADQLGNKPNAIAQLLLLSLRASKNYADDPLTPPNRFQTHFCFIVKANRTIY